jgi:hypothetical protein
MGWYDRKVRRVRDLSCGDERSCASSAHSSGQSGAAEAEKDTPDGLT